jgi:hypothetical protein
MLTFKTTKEFYTEIEAAQSLGISMARLHQLLEEHLFDANTPRPADGVTFRRADLVILGFWHKSTPNPKVVRMPNPA